MAKQLVHINVDSTDPHIPLAPLPVQSAAGSQRKILCKLQNARVLSHRGLWTPHVTMPLHITQYQIFLYKAKTFFALGKVWNGYF